MMSWLHCVAEASVDASRLFAQQRLVGGVSKALQVPGVGRCKHQPRPPRPPRHPGSQRVESVQASLPASQRLSSPSIVLFSQAPVHF